MGTKDPRVDAYLSKAPDFAKPIIEYVREAVHAGCPGVEETVKWGVPSFEYEGPVCGVAAFKQHCRFGFWKGRLVVGDAHPSRGRFMEVRSVEDLPSRKTLLAWVRKAAALNHAGVKAPRRVAAPKKALRTPRDLAAALAKHKRAQVAFAAFSPSHRREYVEWITDAKAAETRARRITTAIEWMAEGKPRNWKYMK